MAKRELSGSVGNRGRNAKADVTTVQDLLNEYILEGRLGDISILDESTAAAGSDTEKAIRLFQTRVMKVPPTGLVRGSTDDVFLSLCIPPKDVGALGLVRSYVAQWLREPPPHRKMPGDLWLAALESLAEHASHPRLRRYSMLTLVDFRFSRRCPRLWIVDLLEQYVHMYTYVAHGRGKDENSGSKREEALFNFHEPYSSKPGAYIATWQDSVKAGQTDANKALGRRGPAVRLQGLDESNRRAADIGILFHGAWYVKPEQGKIGNSRGCFATSFKDNLRIVELIQGGSFVYAYAGEAYRTAC